MLCCGVVWCGGGGGGGGVRVRVCVCVCVCVFVYSDKASIEEQPKTLKRHSNQRLSFDRKLGNSYQASIQYLIGDNSQTRTKPAFETKLFNVIKYPSPNLDLRFEIHGR